MSITVWKMIQTKRLFEDFKNNLKLTEISFKNLRKYCKFLGFTGNFKNM